MKKIMILGAGVYQVPLIEAAKKMGLYTIVCSICGKYPGFDIADRSYYIDTTNKEEILAIAKSEGIAGVCTSGTDVAIPTIGYVCDKLKLNGISYKDSINATNKMYMKKCFVDNGINTARYCVVKNLEELESSFIKLNVEKAVVKIVDKSGSRGIMAIDKNSNFKDIFDNVMSQTKEKYILLEEFVDGVEIGVDFFVSDGKIILFCPHEKLVHKINGIGIPAGHILPYDSSNIVLNNILEQSQKIVFAYNVKNGAINVDAFVKSTGEVFVIEAGARSGASGIPEIISINKNIDYYKCIIKASLGEKIELKNLQNNACASLLIFSDKEGIYSSCTNNVINNISVNMDINKGQYVNKVQNGTDRIGMAIIRGNSRQEIVNKIKLFYDNFKIVIE